MRLRNDGWNRVDTRKRALRLQPDGPGGGGLTYSEKVARIAPANMIGWWRMAEPSGSVSLDSSPQGNNGAYTAVTLNQTGIGDGLTAASFDGTSSLNNIYSAALASDFNGAEGTLAGWAKVSAAGVWSDGVGRALVHFKRDTSNFILIRKAGAANNLFWDYRAGGTQESALVSCSLTAYFHIALTWSKAAEEVKFYLNGVQSGSTATALGTFGGAITEAQVGAASTVPGEVWSGLLAHAMLWNTPLTAAQVLALATVP